MGRVRELGRKFFRRHGRNRQDQADFEEQSRGSCDTQPESVQVVAVTIPTTRDSKDPTHIPDADNNVSQPETSPELASSQQIISPSRVQPSPTPPIDSADQESTIASLPVQLWDRAYNELKQEETKLLDAYEKILSRQLQEGLGSAVPESQSNIIAQDKPDMRRHQMTRLIQSGLDKIERQAKLKGALDKPVEVVLSAKNLISSAIQVVPQAALAWSGICVALEILANPIKQPEANRKGIDYILHRMDWYWSLSNSLFNDPDDPVADLSEVRRELETRIVGLYKALLSYQIKSVCSYFRRSGLTFLRDIIKIDDWDAELGDIKDAEDTFRQDHQAYHHEKNTSQLGELVDHARSRKMQELSREDQQCLKDLHLTNPRDDKSRIQNSKGGLLKDSYRWVLGNPDFQQWRDHKESQLLWIKGDPGKGKTMLLCGIIDELDRGNTANARSSNVAYFFCQATDSRINYATAVLRGLIHMLVDQQRSLISHVRSEYDGAGKKLFDDPNAWEVLSRIFANILQDTSLRTTTLVIDALDECVTDLPQLLDFIAHKSSESSRVKWIVSSRNWPEIEGGLATATQKARLSLELNAESVAAAVKAFIKDKVDQIAQKRGYDANLKEKVEAYLHSHANDTFLWVALVCQALASVSRWRTLEKLQAFPSGLDALYARMLEHINHSDDHELCNQILSVAVLVHRPLSLDEITSLVQFPDAISDDFKALEEIVSLCGSFLTLRERTVYFVHQSAKDFLLGETSESRDPQDVSKWVFPSEKEEVNSKILSSSIQAMSKVLRRDMYALSAPGVMIDEVRTKDPDPLAAVRYSCVYWIHHLCDLISSTNSERAVLQDDGIVHTFLKTKYLYWLEALSLLKAMPEGIKAVRQLQHQLGNSKQGHLLAMIRDAYRFALSFGRIIEQAPLQAYSSALVFAPTGSLVKKYFEQEVPKWLGNRPTVEAEWDACLQTLEGHGGSVMSVVFSPDGRQVASGSDDGTVKVWDTASGSCVRTLKGHYSSVESVVFSPDGRQVASGSDDRTVKVWDTASGSCIRTLEGHGDWVMSVVFSPDGTQVASGSHDGTVKVWDTVSGSCVRTLEGHGNSVTSVVFSPDGTQVASGSHDRTVKVWDTVSGSCVRTLEGHGHWVTSVVFSPDGRQVASGSGDRTVKVWDTVSGSCVRTLEGHGNSVTSVVFSPDGTQVASGSHDGTVKVWDTASGSCVRTLEGHGGLVTSVVFSPDGRQVASGSHDRTVKVWDTASGSCVRTLEGHGNWVTSVVFSPDGRQVASGSGDRTVKVWDTASGSCVRTLEGYGDSVTSVVFLLDKAHLNNTTERPDQLDSPKRCLYGIAQDNSWVTCNSQKVLWLPPGYRPITTAIQNGVIAFSYQTGRVLIISFLENV